MPIGELSNRERKRASLSCSASSARLRSLLSRVMPRMAATLPFGKLIAVATTSVGTVPPSFVGSSTSIVAVRADSSPAAIAARLAFSCASTWGRDSRVTESWNGRAMNSSGVKPVSFWIEGLTYVKRPVARSSVQITSAVFSAISR